MKKINRAVITGASSGIGESLANKLATQGVNLVIAARRTEQLNALAAKLSEKHKISVEVLPIDLTEEGAAEKLFEFATRDGKKVDLLINNAGAGPYRNFLKSTLPEHKKIIQLNMVSLTSLCHLFAEYMMKQETDAFIMNVASVASYQPLPKFAVYCASKSYVRVFSEILKFELRHTNVSVSCLCPGGTKTEFLDKNNQKSISGDRFLMSADAVAEIGIEGTLNRKSIIVPGLFNKICCLYPKFLPGKLNLLLSEKAMAMAVEEQA